MSWPPPFPQLYRLWMSFSLALGFVMSRVILTVLWIAVFGPYAIILKIISLKRFFTSPPETYWIESEKTDGKSFEHQF